MRIAFALPHNVLRHEYEFASAKSTKARVLGIVCGKASHYLRIAGDRLFAEDGVGDGALPLAIPI